MTQTRSLERTAILAHIAAAPLPGPTQAQLAHALGITLDKVRLHVRNSLVFGEIESHRLPGKKQRVYTGSTPKNRHPERLATAPKEQRNIAKITKLTERNPTLSAERVQIENILRRAGHEGIDTHAIASRTGISSRRVAQYITRMRRSDLVMAHDIRERGNLRWVWHASKPAPAPRTDPVRASNQPTGDQAYWKKHTDWVMTPARRDLQG